MNSLDLLVKRWGSQDIDDLPPYGEAVIRATFLTTGIKAARDLVHLYSTIGGMGISTDELWRLWPLIEVEKRQTEANEFGVLFSDYMLDCWAYRVRPNDMDTSSVFVDYFDGRGSFLVAETLEQFFDKYLTDTDSILNHTSCNP